MTWLVLDYVVGSASVLCIVAISLDRFLLVNKGLTYLSSQKLNRTLFIMLSVWLIAFLNYGPAIILWEFIRDEETNKTCHVGFHENIFYLTISACVEFFLPLISICSLNIAVYVNIKRRSKGLFLNEKSLKRADSNGHQGRVKKLAERIRKSNHDILAENRPNVELNKSCTNLNPNDQKKRVYLRLSRSSYNFENLPNHISMFHVKKAALRKDKKAARFLFIIVFTFGICWVSQFCFKN